MEMSDGSQWLIREWETSDMEEAELHRNTLTETIRFLHEKEARLQRMCHFVAVGIVMLTFVALALLIMAVYGRRVETEPGIQPTIQAIRNLTDTRYEEQELNHFGYPMAMLTVPHGIYIYEDYLEWENESGHAFCHGGFSYANRSLVVPRKGMYRVFLQITYESKEGHECRGRLKLNNVVLHCQDAYKRDVSLLSSLDTVSCDMEVWTKSLYTSGLFHLEANSRLRVQSSYPKLIVKTEHQVFFGAEYVPH